uniref:Putative cuticle protein 78e n=1 Tax=Rhodnius prolixus TaxID=13249 RepID=R4G3X3_RHOPR
MNSVILACCLLATAVAYPQQGQGGPPAPLKPTTPPVPIVALNNNINFDGSYNYNFEGGDGTRAEQTGQLKTIGNEAGEVSQGSYSYVGDDGKTYSISYIADETGYHPVGEHLPQAPPTPEAILRSLEFLATAPPQRDESQPQQQQYQQQQQQPQQQQYQQQQQPFQQQQQRRQKF